MHLRPSPSFLGQARFLAPPMYVKWDQPKPYAPNSTKCGPSGPDRPPRRPCMSNGTSPGHTRPTRRSAGHLDLIGRSFFRNSNPGSRTTSGVQVPRRVHAEVPQLGHCIPRACPAQGMQDRRRTSDARPRAYSHILISIPPKYSVAKSAVVVVGPCLVWRLMAGRISGMGATILLIS